MHSALYKRCLGILASFLKQDICNIRLPGYPASRMSSEKLREFIPSHMQYACRYWLFHFLQGEIRPELTAKLCQFFRSKFLYWLEAMSWMKVLHSSVNMIVELQSQNCVMNASVPVHRGQLLALSEVLQDFRRFLLSNQHCIAIAPLQVYCSALLFSPSQSLVRKIYSAELPAWITREPSVPKHWGSQVLVLEPETFFAPSIAYSPKGDMLASLSTIGAIRIWDTRTGAILSEFQNPKTFHCRQIAFSSDGDSLITTNRYTNENVVLWKVATGDMKVLGRVSVIAASPRENTLALGTSQCGIQFLDLHTMCPQRIDSLDQNGAFSKASGHIPHIDGLLFSCDGKKIAYTEGDKIIVREIPSGRWLGQYNCPGSTSGSIYLAAWFSDNETLAFTSDGRTISLWNTSLSVEATAFEIPGGRETSAMAVCRIGEVMYIVLAPRGRNRLHDSIILINASTFKIALTLASAAPVSQLRISPDGKYLAASCGPTDSREHQQSYIRIWDLTNIKQSDVRQYGSMTRDLKVAPRGDVVIQTNQAEVRVSDQLWDTATGTAKEFPPGFDGAIVSADGRFLFTIDETVPYVTIFDRLDNTNTRYDGFHKFVVSPNSSKAAIMSRNTIEILHLNAQGQDSKHQLQCSLDNRQMNDDTFSEDGRFFGFYTSLVDSSAPKFPNKYLTVYDTVTRGLAAQSQQRSREMCHYWSPAGDIIAFLSDKNTLRLWDLEKMQSRHLLRTKSKANELQIRGVTSKVVVFFSPDGKFIACRQDDVARRDGDPFLRIWHCGTGERTATVGARKSWELDLGTPPLPIHPNMALISGTVLVCCSGDVLDNYSEFGVVLINTKLSQRLAYFQHWVRLDSITVSPDCNHLDTNKGVLPLPPALVQHPGMEFSRLNAHCPHIWLRVDWLMQGSERLLWLPQAYRPSKLAFKDSLLVLALQDASLVFLGIDYKDTPIAFEMEHGRCLFGDSEWAWDENGF